jgi:adenylosuccinate synthase
MRNPRSNGRVVAVVGGQYGSEGKGAIVYALAGEFDIHLRTGAPNAGHSFIHDGKLWKMRSVPCGWVRPDATLVIGAGGLIDPALLRREVEQLEAAGHRVAERLLIDANCGILDHAFHELEGGVHGAAHRLIGSTGEGVGPARMARLARQTMAPPFDCFRLARDAAAELPGTVVDTVEFINDSLDAGQSLLLEGTQGSGLSVVHGPWPYVTSTDTNSAQLAADAGIPPHQVDEVILVCRTFPIRVAGNSGPLENERTWEELGLEPEFTTVTGKVRRVGDWDDALVHRALLLNDPAHVALTFLDYLFPADKGVEDWDELSDEARSYVEELEERLGYPLTFLGTGSPAEGKPYSVVRRDR